jgi:hypothetical protein
MEISRRANRTDGEGAEFIFTLPMEVPILDEHILVVEDDPQIRNFICYSLKQEGIPI